MSGADEKALSQDQSTFSTGLRACQACRSRKIRCDRLDPCSSCQASNIPCRTAEKPTQKRQRVLISPKYEEQLEIINARLAQLQTSISSLSREDLPKPQHSHLAVGLVRYDATSPSSDAKESSSVASDSNHYLGQSSFEAHSEEAGKILDALHSNNSPASQTNASTPSVLHSLRHAPKEAYFHNGNKYNPGLPMISTEIALSVFRLIDALPDELFLCTPMADIDRFKEICQRVYFPVEGYSIADFIVANCGLLGVLQSASQESFELCNVDPTSIPEAISMCQQNITSTLTKLTPFLEPSIFNIEALLFATYVAITRPDHHLAWRLISMAARICLDCGLHRVKNDPEDDLLNMKKTWFWLAYILDKGFALNLGRTPNFSDYDITTGYPEVPTYPFYDMMVIWFDFARAQGQIYEKLYSAQGQLQSPERKAAIARVLGEELLKLRRRCKEQFTKMTEKQREPFLDTEVTIMANLTLVYRSIPSSSPHPLRFSDECIAVAREGLTLHQTLCSRFLGSRDYAIKSYVDWALTFSPFTPFIVILGTAILNTDHEDMTLLAQVVDSLQDASVRATGAKRIAGICKVLFKGAQACIEQNLRNTIPPAPSIPSQPQSQPQIVVPKAGGGYMGQDGTVNFLEDSSWQSLPPEDWTSIQLDTTDNMMMLFDNYLAGNPNTIPLYENDLARFDMM
ncbi:hypothetical protein B0O99DRAFT_678074 [Bisporella sp. PMI_857]|nr:hypothetical protein B0O99DRAFT_678074 [Bisporella sp. PMI_857]